MSASQLCGLPLQTFYQEYWRKKPIFVKGGAQSILDQPVTPNQFMMWCEALEQQQNPRVIRLPCGTIFAQELDRVSPALASISRRHQQLWRARNFWFDGTLAVGGSGLGSHYDTSDNFVLQQTGTKHWRLGPRAHTASLRQQRDRLLGIQPEAPVEMLPEPLEFTLEAGDLLYIPLLWAHDGVSESDSLSLTLAYNLDVPLDRLSRALVRQLSVEQVWWDAMALFPTAPGLTTDNELEQYLDALLSALSTERFRIGVKRQWRQLFAEE